MNREVKEAVVAGVFAASMFLFMQWALHHGLHGRTCAECIKEAPLRMDCVGRAQPCGTISNPASGRDTGGQP